MGADAAGVDPGETEFECEIVEEEAGFEVVGAVEDEIDVLGEAQNIFGGDVGDDGFDADGGVDAGEFIRGGDGLGELGAEVFFVEEDLALEVGDFDEIAIDESDESDSRADERFGEMGAEGADTTDEDAGVPEFFLSFESEAVKEDLAAVAGEVGGDVTGHERSQAKSREEGEKSTNDFALFKGELPESLCATERETNELSKTAQPVTEILKGESGCL